MAAHGGVFATESQLVQGKSSAASSSQPSVESWYVVDRVPDCDGPRPSQRQAMRSTKNIGF